MEQAEFGLVSPKLLSTIIHQVRRHSVHLRVQMPDEDPNPQAQQV
jgi:hypothetical protein